MGRVLEDGCWATVQMYCGLYCTVQASGQPLMGPLRLKKMANISQLIFNFMYGLQIVFLNSDLLL